MRVRQPGLVFIMSFMVLGAGVRRVRADDQADAQARKLYDEGQTQYAIGEFGQAIAAYKKAFALSKRPTLLFNIAQAYRLSKDFEQARFFYESFLREMPAAPNRADVEQRVKEMDEALAKQAQAARPPNDSVPPGGVPMAKIPSPDKVAAASPPAGADPLAHTDPSSSSRPIYKKWWFWAGVGAVAVGAAVTVVALSSGGTASAPGTDLGNHNVFGSAP